MGLRSLRTKFCESERLVRTRVRTKISYVQQVRVWVRTKFERPGTKLGYDV